MSGTTVVTDSQMRYVDGAFSQKWFHPVPLTSLREDTSNDVPSGGGILATDTTPTLETVNGDTDSALRVLWATGNVDGVFVNVPLPPWLAPNNPLYIKVYAVMSGAVDTPTLTAESFFDVGDTKVTDTATLSGTTAAVYTITVAASDIPTTFPKVWNFELIPGTHGTDTVTIYSIWVEGTLLP